MLTYMVNLDSSDQIGSPTLKFSNCVLIQIWFVVLSVWEIIGQADGGLSVLRTFRLLRVLKLVRFLPALRRQLVVLMKTMDNVATFCMLLMLFIFTFRYAHMQRMRTNPSSGSVIHTKWSPHFLIFYSILGMHLFGCKFSLETENGDTIPDRKNFDSLLWAIVTVFQVSFQFTLCFCSLVFAGSNPQIFSKSYLICQNCTETKCNIYSAICMYYY